MISDRLLCFLPTVKIKLELDANEYTIHTAGKSTLACALHSLLIYASESQSIPQQVSRASLVVTIVIVWVLYLML